MEQLSAEKAVIDFPRENERVTSSHYTMRIAAPINAEKVEVCVDGAPWQLCRYAGGFWWYDWAGYFSGRHEIVARVLPFDSRRYMLTTRRFSVAVDRGAAESRGTRTQYSVVTDNEPRTLERITQLLSSEDVAISGMLTVDLGATAAVQFFADHGAGLREKLEDAGLPVLEKEVFECELSNSPEELNRLVRSLSERGVAIRSLYGTVEGSRVKLVISVDRPEDAAPVFMTLRLTQGCGA